MSDSNRRDRGALVALALLLATVLVLALIEAGARQPFRHEIGTGNPGNVQQGSQGQVPQVVSSADDFDFWRDPFPQWVMALFTVAATGISLYAIRLVRATWVATEETAKAAIEANATAREIGEAQVRAYLSVAEASFRFTDTGCSFHLILRNSGQSPATRTTITAHLMSPNEEGGPLRAFGPAQAITGPVQAGSVESVYLVFVKDQMPDYVRHTLYNALFMIGCTCRIEWWDVFSQSQVLQVNLAEQSWEWEVIGEDTFNRVGELAISNARHPQQ